MSLNSFWIAFQRSPFNLGCFRQTSAFKIDQRFFIILISDDWAGQSDNRQTSFISRYSNVIPDLWQVHYPVRTRMSGSYSWCSPQSKTSWYALELRPFGHLTRILVPSPFMTPHTIKDAPAYLVVFTTYWSSIDCFVTSHYSGNVRIRLEAAFIRKNEIFPVILAKCRISPTPFLPNACMFCC